MRQKEESQPRFGIITALSKEYAAVLVMLQNPVEKNFPGSGAGRRFLVGDIPARSGKHRVVLLLLPDMGNNPAAIGATLLHNYFPTVDSIIMVGIAGGVPNSVKPEDNVRLGDVVVSDRNGVVQYDYVKQTITQAILRSPPRPPSATLLEAVKLLEAGRLRGERPWMRFIDYALRKLNEKRPQSPPALEVSAENISQAGTERESPRIFQGTIASANVLLKDPQKRDELRDRFGVKAIEMEGSGIADATWNHESGYLVVRGICDYCDPNKNDEWQAYAAIVAAAYARALIESIPTEPDGRNGKKIRTFFYAATSLVVLSLIGVAAYLSSPNPQYQLYVRSKTLPVDIYCDGRYHKTLNNDAPATTIDLGEGEHIVVAKQGTFHHQEQIFLSTDRPSYTVIIPAAGELPATK